MTLAARREDFPLLARTVDGRRIGYLDSAATALKPRAVLAAEARYATELGANVHRGQHLLSEEASLAFEEARSTVARFLGTAPGSVVFTRNTTESLSLVAAGLALAPDDVVLVPSVAEHHSNLVPWLRRARLVFGGLDPLAPADPQRFADLLARHRPRVVTFAFASHLTGAIQPAAELCALARAQGAITVVDAAQAAPHLPIDLGALGCDFLALSGHKLMAPTGIGVLAGRPEALERLDPLSAGGGSIDRVTEAGFTWKRLPYRLEGGTPHIAGALGLAAAVDYLDELGWEALQRHEAALATAIERTLGAVPGIRLLMAPGPRRLAVATVALDGEVDPGAAARYLSDGHGIMVRSGLHCAHPFFERLGLPRGGLRVSAYLYNTTAEIEAFALALDGFTRRLRP